MRKPAYFTFQVGILEVKSNGLRLIRESANLPFGRSDMDVKHKDRTAFLFLFFDLKFPYWNDLHFFRLGVKSQI